MGPNLYVFFSKIYLKSFLNLSIFIMENSKIVVFFTTPNGNANQPFFTGIYTDPNGTQYPFSLWKQTSTAGVVYFKGTTKPPREENAAEPVTPENLDALREYNATVQAEIKDDKKNPDNAPF